jgi:hypothetical protein
MHHVNLDCLMNKPTHQKRQSILHSLLPIYMQQLAFSVYCFQATNDMLQKWNSIGKNVNRDLAARNAKSWYIREWRLAALLNKVDHISEDWLQLCILLQCSRNSKGLQGAWTCVWEANCVSWTYMTMYSAVSTLCQWSQWPKIHEEHALRDCYVHEYDAYSPYTHLLPWTRQPSGIQ